MMVYRCTICNSFSDDCECLKHDEEFDDIQDWVCEDCLWELGYVFVFNPHDITEFIQNENSANWDEVN